MGATRGPRALIADALVIVRPVQKYSRRGPRGGRNGRRMWPASADDCRMVHEREIATIPHVAYDYGRHTDRARPLEARFWAQIMPLKCPLGAWFRELGLPWAPFCPLVVVWMKGEMTIR